MWPIEVKDIRYPSAADGTAQPALFYAPETEKPTPLVVALHPWSASYVRANGGPYGVAAVRRQWVFIHPDFRGPNVRPEACGSELAVEDIVSAVEHCCRVAPVDRKRIYLIGGSGGGYASLLMSGRTPDLWAGVSAWVPILDLAAWYHESVARRNKYAVEIAACCGGAPGDSPEVDREYERRSAKTWLKKAARVPLDVNAGITDGHTGSVPVSHTLRAFNILARPEDRISEDDITYFVENQAVPAHLRKPVSDPLYGEKQPLFRRLSNKVRVTVFQGGHDEIVEAGYGWLEQQRKD